MVDRQKRLTRLAGRFALLSLFVAGCGIFDLRDPEEPTTVEIEGIIPFRQRERDVLTNLELTTEARFLGHYEDALTDDYVFRFSPGEGGSDSIWRAEIDVQKTADLFEKAPEDVDMTWTVRDSGNIGNDFFYRNLGYRLVFRLGPTDSVVVGGRCYLYLREDDRGEFSAFRWADENDGTGDWTWGSARLDPAGLFTRR